MNSPTLHFEQSLNSNKINKLFRSHSRELDNIHVEGSASFCRHYKESKNFKAVNMSKKVGQGHDSFPYNLYDLNLRCLDGGKKSQTICRGGSYPIANERSSHRQVLTNMQGKMSTMDKQSYIKASTKSLPTEPTKRNKAQNRITTSECNSMLESTKKQGKRIVMDKQSSTKSLTTESKEKTMTPNRITTRSLSSNIGSYKSPEMVSSSEGNLIEIVNAVSSHRQWLANRQGENKFIDPRLNVSTKSVQDELEKENKTQHRRASMSLISLQGYYSNEVISSAEIHNMDGTQRQNNKKKIMNNTIHLRVSDDVNKRVYKQQQKRNNLC